MRSRLETLKWLYEEAEAALGEAPPDRKSALIGQLRGIAAEIDEIEGAVPASTGGMTPLEAILSARENRGKKAV